MRTGVRGLIFLRQMGAPQNAMVVVDVGMFRTCPDSLRHSNRSGLASESLMADWVGKRGRRLVREKWDQAACSKTGVNVDCAAKKFILFS